MSGFIPISRKIFESQEWLEVRQYSRFEAWLDLIQQARFEDGIRFIGYRELILKRGEVAISLRFLAERWKWSNHKVDNYLVFLVKQKRITKKTDKGTGYTVITLCKYEQYNGSSSTEGTAKGTLRGQQRDTTGTNRKKDNKENNISSLSLVHVDENFEIDEESGALLNSESASPTPPVAEHPPSLIALDELNATYRRKGFPQQELVMRAVPTHCRSHDEVWMWLDRFTVELTVKGDTRKSWADFQSHFINWLKLQKLPKNDDTKTAKTDNRRGDMSGSKRQLASQLVAAQQEFEQAMAAERQAHPDTATVTLRIP